MKVLVRAWILCLVAICVVGQTLPRPEFEVVSVKPSPEPVGGQGNLFTSCGGGPGTGDPDMYHCTREVLAMLIVNAYGIPFYRLRGSDWMTRQKFEITAKVPKGATRDDFKLMLQSMLAGRFKLAVHHETREMPQYDLVVAKGGPRLQPPIEGSPQGSVPPGPGPQPKSVDGYPILTPGVPGMAISDGKARMFQPKMGLDQLATMLGGQLGKPVTNATGLEGSYAISLYWVVGSMGAVRTGAVGAGAPVAQEPDGPMVEQAIQQQLGLKLEARKGPVDFIVVDHLEKMPVEN